LKSNGYHFYIYTPKDDAHLRKNWTAVWNSETREALQQLVSIYKNKGVHFGLGFSPFGLHQNYDAASKKALKQKIQELNTIGPDILCILFDDMEGKKNDMATVQVEIVNDVMDESNAKHFMMCPSYYSDDPILEKLFGVMPHHYLEELGKYLDASIDIFWTGPKVCSTEYPEKHLKDVTERLERKPFIWDNYPVNDGEKMAPFLHLYSFENRSYHMKEWCAGHLVNPMNQAWLSQIPLKTLNDCFTQEILYSPRQSFTSALSNLCGEELAKLIEKDQPLFQNQGLEKIDQKQTEKLILKYSQYHTPYAQEIVDWLKGEYHFDPECLTN